ncbi:hypothetical protein KAU37_05710 [Candidatus Bipolaricaulota bacterium]|nr:hypothetical protein [Candidatus Bipolaricaulota bacterium]
MDHFSDSLEYAANKLVRDCIFLRDDDYVLLVYDSFGVQIAEALDYAISTVGTALCSSYVPKKRQCHTPPPRFVETCMGDKSVLITALTAADDSTGFRMSLLKAALKNDARIVHMPGLDTKDFIINVNNSDFIMLHGDSIELKNKLVGVSRVTIHTTTSIGEPHKLTFRIEGRPVHCCGGKALQGEIINFPTGEVYTAPLEGEASGSLVLNGSAEDCVFMDSDEPVLVFANGILDLGASYFPEHNDGERLRENLVQASKQDGCCITLCEFGIGINHSIRELTGENVIDEKAAGTAHIALGGNNVFDGTIECPYHHDLIFFPKSINLDEDVLGIRWRDKPKLR